MAVQARSTRKVNPSIPANDGTCHFFRLSEGLLYLEKIDRSTKLVANSEANLALMDAQDVEDDVRAAKRRKIGKNQMASTKKSAKKPVVDANKLQYVNWQLRHETRALGLQYNDLLFVGSPNGTATERLSTFLRHCSDRNQTQIRQITLRDDFLDLSGSHRYTLNPYAFSHVAAFCRANPKRRVNMRIPWVYIPDEVCGGLLFMFVYVLQVMDYFHAWVTGCGITQQLRFFFAPVPENVRFFPREEVFDEEEFQTSLLRLHDWPGFVQTIPGGLDAWVKKTKELYADGF
ncbi:hypothetical protein BU26DRAFT_568816 [Trematosphaeria pertusa]|uniref:Uncharacterized protein n=1 Tax=Trematosphaeria pertusa TaxID=390896 RepID=A0A6A6I3C7_9PLEO|nr:uncharacterized protein BU26DRAFT_568816 [Trematosphaeria pertusa]KAF2244821.1 hypothetical protein BU26DRAFT_568816 [Trematosphaeria pertusa]